jgi:hypothetical protein
MDIWKRLVLVVMLYLTSYTKVCFAFGGGGGEERRTRDKKGGEKGTAYQMIAFVLWRFLANLWDNRGKRREGEGDKALKH